MAQFFDEFPNDGDLATVPNQDETWQVEEGSITVANGVAFPSTIINNSIVARCTSVPIGTDGEAVILARILQRGAGIRQVGVYVRKGEHAVFGRTGIRMDVERNTGSNDECELGRWTNGVVTPLVVRNMDFGPGVLTIRVRADGEAVAGWVNGVPFGPALDPAPLNSAHQFTGIDLRDDVQTNPDDVQIDRIEARDLAELGYRLIYPVAVSPVARAENGDLYFQIPPGTLQPNDVLFLVAHSRDQVPHAMDSAWQEIIQFDGGATSHLSLWAHRYTPPQSQASNVAHDAQTNGGTFTTATPFTFAHTPAGTPRGVLVFISHGTAADLITGVTYGGVPMERVASVADPTGEPGRAYVYFLGANVPTGQQTVAITHTGAAAVKHASCVTMTAGADLEIAGCSVLFGDRSNPQIALNTAVEALRYCVIYSGLAGPANLTPLAGMSPVSSVDFGNFVARVDGQTSRSAGSFTIGYTGTSDDVAMIAVAVQEKGATPPLRLAHPGGDTITGGILVMRGCRSTGSPVDVVGVGLGGTDASIEHDSITPTVDGAMILAVNGSAERRRIPPPQFYTPVFSPGGDNAYLDGGIGGLGSAVAVHHFLQDVAAPTGTVVDTMPAADVWASVLVAFAPEPISPAGGPTILPVSPAAGVWQAAAVGAAPGGVSRVVGVATGLWVSVPVSAETGGLQGIPVGAAVGRWFTEQVGVAVGGLNRTISPAVARWFAGATTGVVGTRVVAVGAAAAQWIAGSLSFVVGPAAHAVGAAVGRWQGCRITQPGQVFPAPKPWQDVRFWSLIRRWVFRAYGDTPKNWTEGSS